MKNKILGIVICAALMLMTACADGNNSSDTSTGTGSSTETSTSNSESEISTDNSTESDSDSGSESDNESSAPTSSDESIPEESTPDSGTSDNEGLAEGMFVHGVWEGSTYTSEFLGLKAEFDDTWTILSDVDIAQRNGIDDMTNESVNNALDTSAVLYEMMAAMPSGTNVNIVIENLNLTNNGKTISEEDYIDRSIGALEDQLASAEFENLEVNKVTIDFLGGEIPCIKINATLLEQEIFEYVIPVCNNTYMGIITFYAANEDEMNSAMSLFKGI